MKQVAAKLPLARHRLEALCVLYVRQHLRCHSVARIALGRPAGAGGNWTVEAIEPVQSIVGDHIARVLIAEMHEHFRMVE